MGDYIRKQKKKEHLCKLLFEKHNKTATEAFSSSNALWYLPSFLPPSLHLHGHIYISYNYCTYVCTTYHPENPLRCSHWQPQIVKSGEASRSHILFKWSDSCLPSHVQVRMQRVEFAIAPLKLLAYRPS